MTQYRHLTPAEAVDELPALQSIYQTVFCEPPYEEGPEMAERFAGWLREEVRRPGFDLVAAVQGGQPVGFAYGYRMPAGQWWRRTDRPAPEEVKAAEKFAVMEWAVLPDHRGKGVGRHLMNELLRNRPEPWLTLTVNPAAAARTIYQRWGWHHVASTRPGQMPGMHIMLLDLSRASPRL